LPKIKGEKWGAAYIRNNFTLQFKKIIFIISTPEIIFQGSYFFYNFCLKIGLRPIDE
jgi:hypothetical protein